MPLILLLIALIGGILIYRIWAKRQTQRTLLRSPLSAHQRKIIEHQVPLVSQLPQQFHAILEGKINVFLEQVSFYGCEGLEVTEEMELSIAAQACLIVVNTETWYDTLTTVLIYPGAFTSLRKEYDGYVVKEAQTVRTGESWSRGPVILSWADTEAGALNATDGHNVALHEFAHQIDDLSGHTDGAPLMSEGQSLSKWEQVILDAYDRHVNAVERGKRTVLDPYGATAHEEFFAVAVEALFEKPAQLSADEPAVYAQLVELLQLDPESWPKQR